MNPLSPLPDIGSRVEFLPDSGLYREGLRTGTIIAFRTPLENLCCQAQRLLWDRKDCHAGLAGIPEDLLHQRPAE